MKISRIGFFFISLFLLASVSANAGGGDVTPPSVPTNLHFTLISPSQLDLAWNPSFDLETGVNHYNIYRNLSLLAISPTTTFNDTTVILGNDYQYRVGAVNGDGLEGGLSEAISTRAVPEPATWSLVALAGLTALFLRRRMRK